MCAHANAHALEYRYSKKLEASDSPELESQAVMSYLVWALGTELGSSGGEYVLS